MLIAWSFTSLPTLPSVIASRPNSLARIDQRAIEQAALFEIANQLRDRRVDQLLHRLGALVAVLVRVPVDERDVLGRDLDVARAAPRSAAAPAGSPGRSGRCCRRRTLAFGSSDEVERLRRRRAQQPVGGVERLARSDSRWKSLPYW